MPKVTPTPFDPDGFANFWASYPKKEAKKDAYKAWSKLRPSPELQAQMLTALSWQREQRDWTKDGGTFVPLPASWIRGERWTDERRLGVTETRRGGFQIGRREQVPSHEPL